MIYGNVLSLQAIESRLLKHPNVRDVSVSRDGEVINITIVEKSPFAIITNGRKMLMADHNFTVYEMKKRPDSEIDLPVISGFSDEISPGIFAKDDLEKLKIGYFIVSTAANISKVLYSFISEIDFTSPEHIKIITSDDASVIYLMDYDFLLNGLEYRKSYNKLDYRDELLKRTIAVKLNYLYAFLNQVKLYKPYDSYEYIDMRYNDLIAVKQKTKQ
jgi:cell division septal protein FtsQ